MAAVTSWFTNVSKQVTELLTIPPEDADVKLPEPTKETEKLDDEEKSDDLVKDKQSDEKVVAEDLVDTNEGEHVEVEKQVGEQPKPAVGSFEFDAAEAKQKAVESAKVIGTSLFSFAKEATKTVSATVKQVKSHIEEHTIIGDFEEEQRRFIEEEDSKRLANQAAAANVAPWVGYQEEAIMKKQILTLALDSRNFLRDPPSGIQFHFDFSAMEPVALATLDEDPNLRKMRFQLVPKQIKEERFWRNYFYRVSLIKQSAQLSTMTRESSAAALEQPSTSADDSASGDTIGPQRHDRLESDKTDASAENEFLSDGGQPQMTEEELAQVRQQLGIVVQGAAANEAADVSTTEATDEATNQKDWEKEILAELNDYELVSQQTGKTDQEWENEISELLDNDEADPVEATPSEEKQNNKE